MIRTTLPPPLTPKKGAGVPRPGKEEPELLAKRTVERAAEQDNAFAVKLYPCYSTIAIAFYLIINYKQAYTPTILLIVTLVMLLIFLTYGLLERRLLSLHVELYYDALGFLRFQLFILFRLFILVQLILLTIFIISGGTI